MPNMKSSDHFRVPVPQAGLKKLQDTLAKVAAVYGVKLVMVSLKNGESGNLLHVSISGRPDMVKLYAESVYMAQASAAGS